MARVMARLGLLMVIGTAFMSGCATTGTSRGLKPEGGSCEQRCHHWGMRLASLLSVGHLSGGCLCENAGGRSAFGAAETVIPPLAER